MSGLTKEQLGDLSRPLDPAVVAQREAGGRRMVSYLEGHEAVYAANRIFGPGSWGHRVDSLNVRELGSVTVYYATVTVTVEGCLDHQDVGVGIAQAHRTTGEITADEHDKAIKSAVTDGLKRALRVYGDQFGLSLYDKDNAIHQQVKAGQNQQNQQNQQRQQQTQPPRQQATHQQPQQTQPAKEQQGWSDGLGLMVQQEQAARAVYDEVKALLDADPDGAAKLPKLLDEMTPDERLKTRAWLQQRAQARRMAAQPTAASATSTSPAATVRLQRSDRFAGISRAIGAAKDAEGLAWALEDLNSAETDDELLPGEPAILVEQHRLRTMSIEQGDPPLLGRRA